MKLSPGQRITRTHKGAESPKPRVGPARAFVAYGQPHATEDVFSPAEGPFKVIRTDIRSDGRGRVTIGQDVMGDTQYRALMNEIGQIILDPVVTVPAREFWLFKNQQALASVVRGVQQAQKGELKAFPSFAAYAVESDEDLKESARKRRPRKRF